LSADQLRHWSLLDDFRAALDHVTPCPRKVNVAGGPERLLTEVDYLSAFLFAQFNPVIDSMRGLCAASELEAVQQRVCSRAISLASFSEAQAVFGFQRLEQVFERLVRENLRRSALGPDSGDSRRRKQARQLELIDSSVFRALPRMHWAQWRTQGKQQRAVRLHLKFNLLERLPEDVRITEGRVCERQAFADMVTADEFYVGDRNYGRDYQLLGALDEKHCGYIIRLCENAAQTVVEELAIDDEDRSAGVVSDRVVRLGARERWHHGPVRVVRIEKPELEEPLYLVTNRLERDELSAALIAQIYHQRWAIELFFRWFKCVLGKPRRWHWFAESEQGVAIQIYSCLIASLLLSERLGKLPDKRTMEMLQFYFSGLASVAEMERFLERRLHKKRS
jgi:hypothetical protein